MHGDRSSVCEILLRKNGAHEIPNAVPHPKAMVLWAFNYSSEIVSRITPPPPAVKKLADKK